MDGQILCERCGAVIDEDTLEEAAQEFRERTGEEPDPDDIIVVCGKHYVEALVRKENKK